MNKYNNFKGIDFPTKEMFEDVLPKLLFHPSDSVIYQIGCIVKGNNVEIFELDVMDIIYYDSKRFNPQDIFNRYFRRTPIEYEEYRTMYPQLNLFYAIIAPDGELSDIVIGNDSDFIRKNGVEIFVNYFNALNTLKYGVLTRDYFGDMALVISTESSKAQKKYDRKNKINRMVA